MNNSVIHLPLDLVKTHNQWQVTAIRGNTARELHIRLHTMGVPFILTSDCHAVITIKKPDGTSVLNDCVIKYGESEVIYTFSSQAVSAAGTCQCQLDISNGSRVIASPVFEMYVSNRSINYSGVVSSSDLSSLTNAIAQASNINLSHGTETVGGKTQQYLLITDREGNTTKVVINQDSNFTPAESIGYVDGTFNARECSAESDTYTHSTHIVIGTEKTYTKRTDEICGYFDFSITPLLNLTGMVPIVAVLPGARYIDGLGIKLPNGSIYAFEYGRFALSKFVYICIGAYTNRYEITIHVDVKGRDAEHTLIYYRDGSERVDYRFESYAKWSDIITRYYGIKEVDEKIASLEYITPEKYGAVGDGATDDTSAIAETFSKGKPVYLPKKYMISAPVILNNSIVCHEGGGIILSTASATVSICPNEQIANRKYDLNVDAHGVANVAITVGKCKASYFRLKVENSGDTGVLINASKSNENRFEYIHVTGVKDGTSKYGVKNNAFDSTFGMVVTTDVECAVLLNNAHFIVDHLHPWLNADALDTYYENSRCIESVGSYILVNDLYQDTVKYGLLLDAGKASINSFRDAMLAAYKDTLSQVSVKQTAQRLCSVEINKFSSSRAGSATPTFEDMHLSSTYGYIGTTNTRSDRATSNSHLHFTSLDDAPTVGRYHIPYTFENMPMGFGSNCIGNFYDQDIYFVQELTHISTGDIYRRIRPKTSAEWSAWVKFSQNVNVVDDTVTDAELNEIFEGGSK